MHAYVLYVHIYLSLSSSFCKSVNAPSSVWVWMCLCTVVYVCVCVCVRPVAGHPSGQVSGRIRASLQWPGGNLEEKRWITEPHWGSKTARLSLLLLKHTHTLMGTHLQPNTPPPPNTDTQTQTQTVLSQSEKRKERRVATRRDTKEWLQTEGGYYYYCWHNMCMHPHTQTHTFRLSQKKSHTKWETHPLTHMIAWLNPAWGMELWRGGHSQKHAANGHIK